MNRTYIDYFIETININNGIHHINCSVVVMVSPPQRLYDRIFKMSVPFVVIFISIQMGILLDIAVLKELTRRPIQVLIGFVCQYMLMPLIAFSITKIFRYKPIYGLGLFVVGCCPGGSISNQWTIIFDGDINLSAFMSFASSVASFFMMPIWLYTLGQYAYLRELKIRIPFFNLAQSLLRVIGPLLIGMILVYFIPKLKLLVQRIVKPLLIFLIIYILVFGSISTFYLFRYLDLKTALTAPLLPWIGFLLGGFFAAICRQDRKRIVTIGIETGKKHLLINGCYN
jgi:sodium/bile acid cotransporter 3/5